MTPDRKIKWLLGLVMLACVVIVLAAALGAFEHPQPRSPMPNPNGYDDFVKAGRMLTGKAWDYSNMKPEELAALVATNAEALKLLRIGLSHECLVPNNYSPDFATNLLTDLSIQKELAMNICAEGRLAEMQHRTNDALQSYLDIIIFTGKFSHGGLVISELVGSAVESLGREKILNLDKSLDANACRKIARTMEGLDVKESTLEKLYEREADFVHKGVNLRYRVYMLINYKERQNAKMRAITKFQNNQAQRRQMMIDFAARAYQLEKDKPPAAVSDLVPDYLKDIPKDPVTGSNLALRAGAP